MQSCYTIYEYSNLNEQCLEGESNENLKSAIKNIYKYLRFSFDSPSYLTDAWNLIFPEPLIFSSTIYGLILGENAKHKIKLH